jgi:hypothetical protein
VSNEKIETMCFVVRNSTSLSMLKCRSRYELPLFHIRISLTYVLPLTKKLENQRLLVVMLKSLLGKFYSLHHDFVNRNEMSASDEMFLLLYI